MLFTVFVIFSFLLGSLPFGYFIAKCKGVDITTQGSGNIGATNVHRVLGKSAGLLVFGLDTLKGLIPTLLVLQVGYQKEAAVFCGLCAVVGHMFSPFLKFKGGKGVSTALGVLLASSLLTGFGSLLIFILVLFLTKLVSLGSLIAVTSMVVLSFVVDHSATISVLYLILGLLILYKHKDNMGRLIRKTENKFSLEPKKPG